MSKIKIITDSTCDLSKELLDKYDIGVVPLYVNLGGKLYKDDGVDVTPNIIYDYVDKNGVLPGTVGVPADDFLTEFKKWRDLGYEVICHTISSDMSCTCQNAKIAAEEVGGVYVVDSKNITTGLGFIVLNSAELAGSGMAAKDIVENSQALISKVSVTFVINTLDYLKKGGRCSTVAAFGANLLKIKPMIVVDNGSMRVGRKFRGPLKKVIEEYITAQLEGKNNIDLRRIFITHTGVGEDIISAAKDRIRACRKFGDITVTIASSTITSHSGPGTLGIIFLYK